MSKPARDRVVAFDGARNVRDLGGLPIAGGGFTRFGVVYRADGLSRLSDADLARLDALGLRSIIDLRYDAERERAPDRLPEGAAPVVYCRGFVPQGSVTLFERVNQQGADAATAFDLMCRNYAAIPFGHVAEFRDLMHYLIRPDSAPHLMHCTSGKDRTGLLAAFVLRALQVPLEAVVADYELSNCEHQPVDAFGPHADPRAVAVIMAARREYLLAAFDAIDARHGSFDAYLEDALEFGHGQRAALRALLADA